jgi:hypothetical protein
VGDDGASSNHGSLSDPHPGQHDDPHPQPRIILDDDSAFCLERLPADELFRMESMD